MGEDEDEDEDEDDVLPISDVMSEMLQIGRASCRERVFNWV